MPVLKKQNVKHTKIPIEYSSVKNSWDHEGLTARVITSPEAVVTLGHLYHIYRLSNQAGINLGVHVHFLN